MSCSPVCVLLVWRYVGCSGAWKSQLRHFSTPRWPFQHPKNTTLEMDNPHFRRTNDCKIGRKPKGQMVPLSRSRIYTGWSSTCASSDPNSTIDVAASPLSKERALAQRERVFCKSGFFICRCFLTYVTCPCIACIYTCAEDSRSCPFVSVNCHL